MALIRWQGKILKRFGKIANSLACCCNCVVCCNNCYFPISIASKNACINGSPVTMEIGGPSQVKDFKSIWELKSGGVWVPHSTTYQEGWTTHFIGCEVDVNGAKCAHSRCFWWVPVKTIDHYFNGSYNSEWVLSVNFGNGWSMGDAGNQIGYLGWVNDGNTDCGGHSQTQLRSFSGIDYRITTSFTLERRDPTTNNLITLQECTSNFTAS